MAVAILVYLMRAFALLNSEFKRLLLESTKGQDELYKLS